MLDQQHRGRPALDRARGLPGEPRAHGDRLLCVDRSPLGADQILEQLLDHVALRCDHRELGLAVGLALADLLDHGARGRRAIELEIDHIARARPYAAHDQHRIGLAGHHDRERVGQLIERVTDRIAGDLLVLDLAGSDLAQVEQDRRRCGMAAADLDRGRDLVHDRDLDADAAEPVHEITQRTGHTPWRDEDRGQLHQRDTRRARPLSAAGAATSAKTTGQHMARVYLGG